MVRTTMTDDLAWVSITAQQPYDRQLVYARGKAGTRHKVVFYASPTPRWIGASIVFQFEYFREWAPLEADDQTLRTTA